MSTNIEERESRGYKDKPLVVLVGPTGVGKSEVALQLAKKINGEIVSADSRQVYKYMDIGTAKPSKAEQAEVGYHLIDIVNPDKRFSCADFKVLAQRAIDQIHRRRKIPILAGGTGLYIRAVINGLFPGPSADYGLRRILSEEAARFGNEFLYHRLEVVDPEAAGRIHPHDRRRIIRALEVFELTGQSISELQERNTRPGGYELALIGLKRPRRELYQRIDERVDRMLALGLVEEVKGLLAEGFGEGLPSMQGVGYKEMVGFLRGEYSLSEAVRLVKRNSRRLAKRQLTWFGKDRRIAWVDIAEIRGRGDAFEEIKKVVVASRQGRTSPRFAGEAG
jgi:tRNA dimethylallyltransferase